ncbi:MAG TPA: DUF2304 domain-containing protein [Flavisolibacter sp.]|nr:DUF2304 domain-containing protein [Flavisolibacter sp.]
MKSIQIILLGLLLLLFTYIINKLKNGWVDLLLFTVLILTGAIFIIVPDWTIYIAHTLGVGRGADLIFYFSIILFWFVIVKMYSRIRRLEQIMTEIVRNDALSKTASPEKESYAKQS